jgi:glycosyltransferase involved in cell wall biosynthesis
MINPNVSIILPTFNRADILEECLNHVISQEYINWELVIIDDCSQDSTIEIATRFEKNNFNIKYYKNPVNKGLPASRNLGILRSNYDLIFFIEDDLLLDKCCLKILVETYSILSPDKKVGGIMPRLIDDISQIHSEMPPIIINKYTGELANNYSINTGKIVESFTMHACSLYPKKVILEAGGYAEKIFKGNFLREETDLNCRIRRMGYKFYFQPKAFAYHKIYRKGGCRVSSNIISDYFIHRNHILFVMRNFGLKSIYIVPIYVTKHSIYAVKNLITLCGRMIFFKE